MNNSDEGFLMGVFAIIFFGLITSGLVTPIVYYKENDLIKKRAIQKEHAYYDKKTGNFTWSDNTSRYIFTGENK